MLVASINLIPSHQQRLQLNMLKRSIWRMFRHIELQLTSTQLSPCRNTKITATAIISGFNGSVSDDDQHNTRVKGKQKRNLYKKTWYNIVLVDLYDLLKYQKYHTYINLHHFN